MQEQGSSRGSSNPLGGMSQTQMFVFGIISGILVLCTIGFFILLGIMMNGGSFGSGTPSAAGPNIVAPNPNPAPGANPQISVRPVDSKTDHIRGNKDAKVSIVTYTDFECPFCKRFHPTMEQIIAQYGDDVRWVYRQLPLDSLHAQARSEALATECAAEQGKFWELADLIFEKTPSNDGLDLTQMSNYAKEIGLNVNKFNECWNSQKYASAVQEDEADAQNAGAQGTPYSVVIGPNGELVPVNGAQPYAQVEAAIKQFLN